MNALVPQNFGAVSSKFAAAPREDDLGSGVQQGFPILGYKGKVWTIRHRGTDTPLMRDDGDGPRGSVELVIVKASKDVSKIWYENGYVEGSSAAPDCFSTNGVTPDISSQKRQSNACANCPMNAWGSRTSAAGKQGKACSDSKRLAVAPLNDVRNEAFGGVMLLRVPAASLREVAGYGEKMQAMGYPYFSIGTRVSFDPAEAYPKFILSAIRPLTDAEADAVLELRDSPAVARLLAEGSENAASPAALPPPAAIFEQPPAPKPVAVAPPAPPPAPAPVAPKPAASAFGGSDPVAPPKAPPPPAQAPAVVNDSNFEAALDAQLNDLLGAAS
jgi:hypothetical protein